MSANPSKSSTRAKVEECANQRGTYVAGAFLPYPLSNAIPSDLDGRGCRSFLESLGYTVISNRDTGANGEAVTACGLVLSTNGYVHRDAESIVKAAIAQVSDLRLNKAGNDIDGNASNGLETKTTRALAKFFGFDWKKRTGEQYTLVHDLMKPVYAAIRERRNTL